MNHRPSIWYGSNSCAAARARHRDDRSAPARATPGDAGARRADVSARPSRKRAWAGSGGVRDSDDVPRRKQVAAYGTEVARRWQALTATVSDSPGDARAARPNDGVAARHGARMAANHRHSMALGSVSAADAANTNTATTAVRQRRAVRGRKIALAHA
jgi:hypothetical protein